MGCPMQTGWAFVWLYRLCPAVVDAVTIVRPETLIRWRRAHGERDQDGGGAIGAGCTNNDGVNGLERPIAISR